jgi:two-component system nitrate/nitrite response regulator NarL
MGRPAFQPAIVRYLAEVESGLDPVPIVVVSADPLARGGLAALVAARPDLRLAGEASPRSALAAARPGTALLWDLGTSGEVPDELGEAAATGALLALCEDETQAGDALRAGAQGALLRGAAPATIAAALQTAAQGLAVLDPSIAAAFLRPPERDAGGEPLTPRERQVLALLAEGLANKAIAARLGISDHTAKFHVNAILGKLGVDSRAEAVVRAVRAGLVSL